MPRKRTTTKAKAKAEDKQDTTPIVTFEFQDRTYQIDPDLRKVYRRFVEIETSKAAEIFSIWRAASA